MNTTHTEANLNTTGASPCLWHSPSNGGSGTKVLAVASDADMRNYLCHLLENRYDVITVANSQQALRAASEHRLDLILAHVAMPFPDGFGLLKLLRADPTTATIPVILLSAQADQEACVKAIENGADDCFIMPVNVRQLLARVRRTVDLTRIGYEAQRRERELRAETASILDSMKEGFLLVDADWRILYINAAGETLSGVPRDRLLGRNHWDAYPAALGTIVERNYRSAMEKRVPIKFEHYYEPYCRWFESSATPVGKSGLLLYAYDITDRKQAEHALKETDARLTVELEGMSRLRDLSARLLASPNLQNALEEVLDAAITMLGADMGSVQFCNPKTRVLEIVAQRGFRQDLPDHFGEVKVDDNGAWGRAMKSGERLIIEDMQGDPEYAPHRPIAADAGYRAVQSTPLVSRDGQLLGVLSTHFRQPHRPSERDLRMLDLYTYQAIDLIERIRAEDALRASEQRATLILNSISDGFEVLDASGRFVYVNAAARRMLAEQGMNADDLIGKQHLIEIFQAARDDVSGRAYRRAMADRVPVAVENFYPPFKRWYAIRFFPMDRGGLAIVIQDITERKCAEEALRESEAKFRALAEASPALIALLDPDGNVVYMNQRHSDMYGDAWPKIRGTGWHAMVHPDDALTYIPAIGKALHDRSRFQQRVRVKSKNDEWRWVEAYGLPWFAADGRYAGHVFVTLDITHAVQAEDALKEAGRRKDEFLATLAHELRNPLATICNAIPLIGRANGVRTTDRLQPMMERQGKYLVRLVDDLMDVSRITRGKIELRRARIELADVVRDAIEISKPLIDKANHQLTVSLPPQSLALHADAVRLNEVFTNLLSNAAKYTDEKGQIFLTAYQEGNDAVVSVRDNGIGISPEMLPHVFEMFAQQNHASPRAQSGLGIGLTVVRSLVQMHGGRVEAKSEGLGRGTEFIVRLPLIEASRPTSSPNVQGATSS